MLVSTHVWRSTGAVLGQATLALRWSTHATGGTELTIFAAKTNVTFGCWLKFACGWITAFLTIAENTSDLCC